MFQCAYLLYLSFSLEGFRRWHLSVSSFSPTLALASWGQSFSRWGFWAAMITPVFFICNYGPQAQYERWTGITGLYDPTIITSKNLKDMLTWMQTFNIIADEYTTGKLFLRSKSTEYRYKVIRPHGWWECSRSSNGVNNCGWW